MRILNSLHLPIAPRNASFDNQRTSIYPLNKLQKSYYAQCERLWSYGGKIALIARNILNAAAKSSQVIALAGADFPNRVKTIVTKMKLLSIVSVPFTLVDLRSTVEKAFKSLSVNDNEGLFMSTLSLTIITTDAFDSITTFVNALLAVAVQNSNAIFSSLSLPIGFVIAGTGTVSRTIQTVKAFNLHRKIRPDFFSDIKYKDKSVFKKVLEEKLGIDEEERLIKLLSSGHMNKDILEKVEKLKEKKKAIIARLIPKDAVEAFKKLYSLLEIQSDKKLTDQEFEEVFKCLTNVRWHLKKKMKVELIGILANLIAISALTLFAIGNATALPFLLLSAAFLIRLISLIYQEQHKLQEQAHILALKPRS